MLVCQKSNLFETHIIHIEQLPTLDLVSTNFQHLSSDYDTYDTNPDTAIPFEPYFKYYSQHDFHKRIKTIFQYTNRTFSIFHTNIRSITFNHEMLSEL